jgi:hypothetical protein
MAPDILDFIDTDRHDRSLLPVLDPLLHDILDRLADFVPGGAERPRGLLPGQLPRSVRREQHVGLGQLVLAHTPGTASARTPQARQSTRRMQYSNTTMQPQSGTNSNRVGLGDPTSLSDLSMAACLGFLLES